MHITEDWVIYCDYWLPNKNALTIPVLTRIRVRLAESTSSNKLKKKKRTWNKHACTRMIHVQTHKHSYVNVSGLLCHAEWHEEACQNRWICLDTLRVAEYFWLKHKTKKIPIWSSEKQGAVFLISNFRRVLNLVCILLGISPASDCSLPTFRNTLSVPSSRAGCEVWSTSYFTSSPWRWNW